MGKRMDFALTPEQRARQEIRDFGARSARSDKMGGLLGSRGVFPQVRGAWLDRSDLAVAVWRSIAQLS